MESVNKKVTVPDGNSATRPPHGRTDDQSQPGNPDNCHLPEGRNGSVKSDGSAEVHRDQAQSHAKNQNMSVSALQQAAR
jgi:hypothetical protein